MSKKKINNSERVLFWKSPSGGMYCLLTTARDRDKLEIMTEVLATEHLALPGASGGYPLDHIFIDGVLVLADADQDEPSRTLIRTYREEQLLLWYDRAIRLLLDRSDDPVMVKGSSADLWLAVIETDTDLPPD